MKTNCTKMEYNLLKTIEPNWASTVLPPSFPRLTPFPATDYINPGLGQISRLFSFYVPLHSQTHLHTVTKKVNTVNLEGSGKSETTADTTNDESSKDDTNDAPISDDIDPIEFNETKRKRLGPAIQESFLHPKLIKTNKIVFKKQLLKKNPEVIKTESKPKKEIKHKFQFI